jgi:hypothetical protein
MRFNAINILFVICKDPKGEGNNIKFNLEERECVRDDCIQNSMVVLVNMVINFMDPYKVGNLFVSVSRYIPKQVSSSQIFSMKFWMESRYEIQYPCREFSVSVKKNKNFRK